ncbi:resolvase [Blautia sp. OM07-19]|uniref:recombinase family protein n=1 Tax=Blautia sp. OM07-19 TaxID=2292985 RepID=UPI000E4A5531|nr:recombinase family protein [Blautia sp. OM07-19]RHV05296.1 resolvase [Blautia sp. OM07-19]
MGRLFGYLRISTKEERRKQKFTRQEHALKSWCAENNEEIPERRIYRDDASGKNFNRASWKEMEQDVQAGDTIIFKDICRFTRERDNGYKKYMELLNRGIELIFLDNPTLNTEYIKSMQNSAEKMKRENIVGGMTLEFVIRLLLVTELDKAEKERETTVKRIKDGIAASDKKSGRKIGQLDKLSPELENDIRVYLVNRSVKQIDLINRYNISRNTLKKYIKYVASN